MIVASTPPSEAWPDWAGRLHASGLRSTSQRLMILDELHKANHVIAQQIHDRLAGISTPPDVSTIYRNLQTLTEIGLVSHVHLGGLTPSYVLAERAPYGHLVCRNCGHVTELSADITAGLAEQLAVSYAFDLDISHLSLFGRCQHCHDSAAKP